MLQILEVFYSAKRWKSTVSVLAFFDTLYSVFSVWFYLFCCAVRMERCQKSIVTGLISGWWMVQRNKSYEFSVIVWWCATISNEKAWNWFCWRIGIVWMIVDDDVREYCELRERARGEDMRYRDPQPPCYCSRVRTQMYVRVHHFHFVCTTIVISLVDWASALARR